VLLKCKLRDGQSRCFRFPFISIHAQTQSVTGDKANVWKCAYHNGRALIEALNILKR